MNIICDKNNIIQDISTEIANLSRGYTFADYKFYQDLEIEDMRIGDTFDGANHIKNNQIRIDEQTEQANEQKIQDKIRADAVNALIAAGQLPAEYK